MDTLLLRIAAAALVGSIFSSGLSEALPHGYRLRDEDVSPDKTFGVIHADASVVDPSKARNFLVALQPFRLLSENLGFPFCENGGEARAMAVEWSKDRSAVLVMVGGKWGTIGATLFELKKGRVTRRSDLMAAVTRFWEQNFRREKSDRSMTA